MSQKVLDLDGDVIREFGKLGMQRPDGCDSVSRPVEKIRIAKGDVLGTLRHEIPNVGHDNLSLDDTEPAVIDGHDRTMPAAMFASATRLRVADDASAVIRPNQSYVSVKGGQTAAVRLQEYLFVEGDMDRFVRTNFAAVETAIKPGERAFEFSTDDGVDAKLSEPIRVGRRVQPETAYMGGRIQFANPADDRFRQARRRVHGYVDRHHSCVDDGVFAEFLDREIETPDVGARLLEPGSR